MRRFWIRLRVEQREPSPLGWGVTAHDRSDAVRLLRSALGSSVDILSMAEDVDVSTLDAKHVLPNMDAPAWRGIWFPRGYSHAR